MTYSSKSFGKALAVIACGGLMAAAALAQQPLLNVGPPAEPQPGTPIQYAPVAPPAASDPGVLEAPALIARKLNESDLEYTSRMQQKNVELKAETSRLLQRHDAVMREILTGFGGRKEARFPAADFSPPPAQSLPVQTAPIAAPAPAQGQGQRTDRGTLLNN